MGKLIVLEGLDASGKSTQVKKIKEYFNKNKITYEHFHFPMYGHNQFSSAIEKILRGEFGGLNQLDPYFIATCYAMDRFMFKPELEKALEENDVVFLDRYVFSNIAYQCAKCSSDNDKKVLSDWIWDFEFRFLQLPYPQLILFLDVPIDVIKERLSEKREGGDRNYLNGKQDIHEASIQFQGDVRDQYLNLKNSMNYAIINCRIKSKEPGINLLNPNDVFENYIEYLDTIIKYT